MRGIAITLARAVFLVMLLASLVMLVVLANPLAPQEVQAQPASQRSVAFTDVNPIGVNLYVDREVEAWKRDLTFRMAREAGAGWVRILFSWEGIEPRPGSFFDEGQRRPSWDKYDDLVSLAEAHGLRIIARLDRTPEWARGEGTTQTAPPRDVDDYARFAAEVARRYQGRIQHFQIWNEPNLRSEWGDRPADPAAYLQLLRRAAAAIRAVNQDAVILSAPMAQTLDNANGNRTELSFVEELYRLGWQGDFDILSANAYGFDRPPEDPADPAVLNFARLDLLREIMVANGDEGKAVWIAEFGWNAAPASFPPEKLVWRRVSEQDQADFSARGLELARQRPWIGVVNLWYLRQVGDISAADDAAYYFRAVDVDFTPRLLWFALRDAAQALGMPRSGWFEESAMQVRRTGQWRDVRDPQASGGVYMVPRADGAQVRFRFRGTELTGIFTGRGDCGTWTVTVDGSQGRGVNVPASATGAPRAVLLASGLADTEHTVTIAAPRPLDAGRCGLDALEAGTGNGGAPPWMVAAGVALLSLAGFLASVVAGRLIR